MGVEGVGGVLKHILPGLQVCFLCGIFGGSGNAFVCTSSDP